MATKVGLQLIIYGERGRKDLPRALAEIRRAGYVGVEMGMPSEPAESVKELLDANRLVLSGLHTSYQGLADDEARTALIDALATLGGDYLICSGVADPKLLAGYEQAGALFNRVGAECRTAGLTFCYHNHAWEFAPLEGGVKGIHRLAEVTDPGLVKFNIDVYWVHIGGEDPAVFIRRYADRAGYYHFKDGRPGEFTPLGQGEVDLQATLKAALQVGVDWIVYEQDRPIVSPNEDAIASRKYLRSLGV